MTDEPSKTTRPWSEHPGIVVAVFVVALVVMVVRRQLEDATWVPHGADWDTWYQSVASIGHWGIKYPPNRWPAYALYGALFGILPGPLHVNVQVASLAASAGSVTGLFLISRSLLGLPGALTVAALSLTFPIVVMLSSWISAYPLWATASIWAVAGLVEALRTGRRGWWYVSGAGLAFVLAVMAKGLGIGLALLALVVVGSLLTGRKALGNLARVAAPLAVMAVVYLAFPSPLLTLDAQVSMQSTELGPPANARIPTARGAAERSPLAPQGEYADTDQAPVSDSTLSAEQRSALFEGGYIYGRSMNPVQLYGTLRGVQRTPEEQRRRLLYAASRLERLFPTVDQNLIYWLVGGAAGGLLVGLGTLVWRARRGLARAAAPLVGWLGILGIIAGVVPSVMSMFTPRFLTPAYFVVPLFLVAPVALLTRWTRWTSWLSFALLPLSLIPTSPWQASPWLHGSAIDEEMGAVEIHVPEAVQLWYMLARDLPDANIYVMTAPNQGLLVLQGRDGNLYGGDPRFTVVADEPPGDHQYILTAEAAPTSDRRSIGAGGGFQEPSVCKYCTGRTIAQEIHLPPVLLKLYNPTARE